MILASLFFTGVEAAEEPIVARVEVRATGPVERANIAEVLEIVVGKPLDRTRLRNVIMTMYAGGRVEKLRVEAGEGPDGLDVVVHISFRSTISDIKVRTGKPLMRVKVHRWLQLNLGDPVIEAGIEASRRRVERRLHDRGYADARVDAYLNYHRKTNTVVVEFEVDPGPQQVVGSAQ